MTAAIKYVFALLLMTGVLYACAVDGYEMPESAGVSQVDQEVAAPPADDLVIGGCDDGFCPDENSPGNCRICTGGGGGGGGTGDPTGGGGGGGGGPLGACSAFVCDPTQDLASQRFLCGISCGRPEALCLPKFRCGSDPSCPEAHIGYCWDGR